jgi:hypothetical protein
VRYKDAQELVRHTKSGTAELFPVSNSVGHLRILSAIGLGENKALNQHSCLMNFTSYFPEK